MLQSCVNNVLLRIKEEEYILFFYPFDILTQILSYRENPFLLRKIFFDYTHNELTTSPLNKKRRHAIYNNQLDEPDESSQNDTDSILDHYFTNDSDSDRSSL
jgi:hypothetical protein